MNGLETTAFAADDRPRFGTSGLRGKAVHLTDALVADYVRAFLAVCPVGTGLWVGRDLRESSPRLAAAVIAAARDQGLAVVDCGRVATPVLAQAAGAAGAGAVMVTGSHISADRNGLKFYTPRGEITKADEAAITAALGRPAAGKTAPLDERDPNPGFMVRLLRAFGAGALSGLRLGVWEHSSVARELLCGTLEALGAEVIPFGRSGAFVPVDTEAVDEEARALLARMAARHGLFAIVSTDGDADRPLLADETGALVPGDLLGQITARFLGAAVVVTPVSANTGVERMVPRVIRTRIGSPYVIAAIEAVLAETPSARVVGYEANGGFLLGFTAAGPAGPLAPLLTRDSFLPLLSVLVEAKRAGGVSARVAAEPQRFTAADRLTAVSQVLAQALIARLAGAPETLANFLAACGEGAPVSRDETDGLRLILPSGRILHLRPSGNAPELRLYVEAETLRAAQALLVAAMATTRAYLATEAGS